ncbi:MAG: AAA family ATPase [Opitutales bacterium]|nr:AAA family ATPase [Opitutales bacterium]
MSHDDQDKDKETPNPFEEMQKQLQEMLRQGGGAGFNPFMGAQSSGSPPPENPKTPETSKKSQEILDKIRTFQLKPKEIKDYLDRFVIRQNEAKKVLSVAICDHYNHVRECLRDPSLREKDYAKQNIILLGPTGVGKTYLMRCIARLIGVPFVKADATKFSETGYVGHDVEDLVRDLVKNADGDVDLAEYGIIYIDEIDKIAGQGGRDGGGRDVSGRGVQVNLLKLMEESEVNLHSQTDILGQMQAMMSMQKGGKPGRQTINTRHILFIVSGAFDQLAEQVKKRVSQSSIGFSAPSGDAADNPSRYLSQVATTDFIKYGFEPEFVGRLPIRVTCSPLDKIDLEEILLSSEGSILSQYLRDFKGYDIDCEVEPEAIGAIAEQAAKENTGARGLMTVLERMFRNFKYELPSSGIRKFTIDAETASHPADKLQELLENNRDGETQIRREEVEKYASRFHEEHGLSLVFTDEAITALVEESHRKDITIRALCEKKFRDFHHGLLLISRNTGEQSFTIDQTSVNDPDGSLSKRIVASYRKEE